MIDLGPSVEFEVKWAGEVFKLREPTALEMAHYQKQISSKKDEVEMMESLIKFVGDLGMPEAAAKSLPISKLNVLIESLISQIAKKN